MDRRKLLRTPDPCMAAADAFRIIRSSRARKVSPRRLSDPARRHIHVVPFLCPEV